MAKSNITKLTLAALLLITLHTTTKADVITIGPGSASITACAMSYEWDHGAGFNFLLQNTSSTEIVDSISFAQWFAPLTLNLAPGQLGSFSVYSLSLQSGDITVNTAPYLRDTAVVYTGVQGDSRPLCQSL